MMDDDQSAASGIAVRQPITKQLVPEPDWSTFDTELAGDPLIASAIGPLGVDELRLRFTPQNTNLAFSSFCRSPDATGPEMEITLNGSALTVGSCHESDRANAETVSRDDYPKVTGAGWSDLGVRPGLESVLRMRVTRPKDISTAKGTSTAKGMPQPRDGVQLGIAVYELSGPRVVSDGVIIKELLDYNGRSYTLGGHRTAKITTARRELSLTVPATAARALVTAGMPTSNSTSADAMRVSLDGKVSPDSTSTGTITFPLPDIDPHLLKIRARPDDTGVMLLAWYQPTE